jgi:glycosyltransferase involved in cell wall biosynthesis
MRILVISNFYPPHYIGGYEIGCADVVNGLRERGHKVCVLTSFCGLGGATHSGDVFRWLRADQGNSDDASGQPISTILLKELANRHAFKRLAAEFKPDLIYVWNVTGISISLLFASQKLKMPTCYYISDDWLSRWKADAGYSLNTRRPGRLSRRVAWKLLSYPLQLLGVVPTGTLTPNQIQFASLYLKKASSEAIKSSSDGDVIHWGVDVNKFAFDGDTGGRARNRLLYVGQLAPHKGVQTALEALRILVADPTYRSTHLTIVGGPDYGDAVAKQVSSLGLEPHVRLTGQVSRHELPAIYREHGVLLFPSIWEEPFSITLLEAMSCGLAPVSTRTGGTAEILRDDFNALIFSPNDATECANQLRRFMKDDELYERVRFNAGQTVRQQFSLEQMLQTVERSLLTTLEDFRQHCAGEHLSSKQIRWQRNARES